MGGTNDAGAGANASGAGVELKPVVGRYKAEIDFDGRELARSYLAR
jgi:hypothetical protein